MAVQKPILVTKILRPGAPRVAKLTENFTLPRSVPLPSLLAAVGGGTVGLLAGIIGSLFLPFETLTLIMLSAVLGGCVGVGLVQWQPWRGESVIRVVTVRSKFSRQVKSVSCPGVGQASLHDDNIGCEICPHCRRVIEPDDDGVTPQHSWKRKLYVGMMPVGEPVTGVTHMIIGSLPVRDRQQPRSSAA